MPLTLCWSPPPTRGRSLFVVFAYHGRDNDGRRTWMDRFESSAARDHRILHRDHYANPRDVPYLLGLLQAAMTQVDDADARLVIDRQLAEAFPGRVDLAGVEFADPLDSATWRRGALKDADAYDNLVFIYPDALGLGCERAEQYALYRRRDILIVNGRRRAFRLTASLHRRLELSRWLARTRVVERLFAAAVRPIGTMLALSDDLLRRR
jgi:hypothetical protein